MGPESAIKRGADERERPPSWCLSSRSDSAVRAGLRRGTVGRVCRMDVWVRGGKQLVVQMPQSQGGDMERLLERLGVRWRRRLKEDDRKRTTPVTASTVNPLIFLI